MLWVPAEGHMTIALLGVPQILVEEAPFGGQRLS